MTMLNEPLASFDPDIAALIDSELHRQQTGLEMIASENSCAARCDASHAVAVSGSCTTSTAHRVGFGMEFRFSSQTIGAKNCRFSACGSKNCRPGCWRESRGNSLVTSASNCLLVKFGVRSAFDACVVK
jgi:Serine hydroxymethyltransferase